MKIIVSICLIALIIALESSAAFSQVVPAPGARSS